MPEFDTPGNPGSPTATRAAETGGVDAGVVGDGTSAALAEGSPGGQLQAVHAQLAQQSRVQRNETPPEAAGADQAYPPLVVSPTGFAEVLPGASIQPIAAGRSARDRPDEVLSDTRVDQIVLGSFGYRQDAAAMRARRRSADPPPSEQGAGRDASGGGSASAGTPVSPQTTTPELSRAKIQQRVRAVTTGPVAVSHLITRSGDILSSVPWNRAPAGFVPRQLADRRVEERAVYIELEALYTADVAPREQDSARAAILNLIPYTDQQIAALAFLMRKLCAWSGQDTLPVLGVQSSEVLPKTGTASGHAPGMFDVGVFGRNTAVQGAGGEFSLPLDWKIGDPPPAHLQSVWPLWEQRIELYYRRLGYGDGSQISAWKLLEAAFLRVREYDLSTEVFSAADAAPVYTPAIPRGTERAIADVPMNAEGRGYARSQRLQGTPRTGLYDAAASANDAAVLTGAQYTARLEAVATTTVTAPVVVSALGFDFATGTWVTSATFNVPDPTTVRVQPPQAPPRGGT